MLIEPRDIEYASKDDIKDILVECGKSLKTAAKVFYPKAYYRPFAKVHDKLFEAADDESVKRLVVTAFRGCGKTTLFNITMPSVRMLLDQSKFVVPLGATYTHAEEQSENLKKAITNNPIVARMFGDIKSKDSWSKEKWKITRWSGDVSYDNWVMPRGGGQQVRGLLEGTGEEFFRPDLIVGDDIMKSEYIESDEQRRKLKDWFFADVANIIEKGLGGPGFRIIVVGTIMHEDDLLLELISDPDWVHIDIPLCDDNFKSVWPAFMTDDMVAAEYDSFKRKGKPDIFYREYMNQPISKLDAVFRQNQFMYHTRDDIAKNNDIEFVVLVDPSKTDKPDASETAIVGAGIDIVKNRIFVDDIVADRMLPDRMYDETFRMADRLGASAIGIEVTSLNEFIMQPFRNEMSRRGRYYQLVELKARGKKADRVKELSYYYNQGLVSHNPACCRPLELQLLSFPRSKRWDVMDALSYVVPMMAAGERYFVHSAEREDKDMEDLENEVIPEYEEEEEFDYEII